MIFLKSPQEIEKMAKAGRIVAEVLESLREMVRAGVTTREIEGAADAGIRERGGTPAFKGYRGYPASVCISINEQVVHGIPSARRLRDGDIASIDLGVYLDGFYGDAAISVPVGEIDRQSAELLRVTEEALYLGIRNAVEGNRLYDISAAVQRHVEKSGFSVVRMFVGHGIGRELHEEPQIPNYGSAGQGPRLKSGMTLAIEPMVNAGSFEVRILDDGWTAVTVDGKKSAHFEHTVAVTHDEPIILTKLQ
ncbi:MAG: type I methionyl aminopeptidase [Nitrospiraceae bacterium]|nr:type I methionyl aminopeptidase [Nitrospiraceae bacterium]